MTTAAYQTRREKRPPMTPEEATRFERYSAVNAAIVASALPCGCEPYRDVFTYNRWLGLGMQVQRGSKAVKLAIMKVVDEIDEDGPTGGTIKVRAGAAVFCRHQVAPVAPRGERENPGKRRVPREGGQRKSGPESHKVALTLSYGSTVIGHDGPTTPAPQADNAAVDSMMAGFEVLS